MKSKFAKIIDRSLGAVLLFFAATAVLRYYTPLYLAAFAAVPVTACALILLSLKDKKSSDAQKLTAAADGMFYDFMFLDAAAPARLLHRALKQKDERARLIGKGVYLNRTAAFCLFASAPDEATVARLIAKSEHYGATKLLLLCKTPPASVPSVNGMTVKALGGNDVYKLFASLGALPEHKHEKPKKRRRDAFSHALGADKILRYALLAVGMLGAYMLLNNIVALVCAAVCAALAVAATVTAAVKKLKANKNDPS